MEALHDSDDPAILAGHSMAGGVTTQTAEQHPSKIDMLIYLSAILPHDGASLLEMGQAEENADSLVGQNLIVDEGRGVADLPHEIIHEAFYADCSEEDVTLAQALLHPEPLDPYTVPITTTDDRFGSIPRVYIETLEDNALTPAFQALISWSSETFGSLTSETER